MQSTTPRRRFTFRGSLVCLVFLVFGFLVLGEQGLVAENWPQWRGPQGTGVSRDRELPVHWNTHRGIVWKCELPGWGTSTPAVWEDAIFVTTQTDDGRLWLLGIHRRNGKIVWQKQVGQGVAARQAPPRSTQKFHRLHNLATPSPVTNGELVAVHFGNGDLAVFDFQGSRLWKRNLQEDLGPYSIWWGHANSPVFVGDLLISVCMQDSLADKQAKAAESYVIAHDARTGDVRWKTPRMTGAVAEQGDAYTTPLLWRRDGRDELVVMGGNQLDAYEPLTGKQIWWLPNLSGGRTVTGPTYDDGLLYATRGMRGPLLAVRPRGTGELTDEAIVWSYDRGTPDSCSPVIWDRWLFNVTDDGIARCFAAQTGELLWKERLRGQFKASPIAAHGRIFFLNTEGLATVVAASPRFEKAAENQIEDETIASPAVSDGQIFLRGRDYLWCIGRL